MRCVWCVYASAPAPASASASTSAYVSHGKSASNEVVEIDDRCHLLCSASRHFGGLSYHDT